MGLIQTPGSLITNEDAERIYVFDTENQPAHVMEIPGVRFNDFPVCLACKKTEELPKMKWALREFHKLWEKVASEMCNLKP